MTIGLNCRPWVPYSHMHMCRYTCNYILVLLSGWWTYLLGRPELQLRYKLLGSTGDPRSLFNKLHSTDFQQITTSWKQPQNNFHLKRVYISIHNTYIHITWHKYRPTYPLINGHYTEQKYKHNTFVFAPIFHELNSKIKCFLYTQKNHSCM